MRRASVPSLLLLVLLSASAAAEDLDHGRQLAERWCAACHAVATEPTKFRRARPFVAIAARDGVTKDMLVKFLLLPHATMANNPLSANDATDLAGYILSLRK
ncbi:MULTISPECIES: cytochrome c [unclassified Bradyrhizobium]|uniref:c-type cytochrome n=1 Tax=unclassified Bradyrhizobium TaxID=2631580 RepID=UPI0028E18BDD|nr:MULTISPECIES: cytochrome c [unclassified Bradyrhizobium]